MLQLSESMSSSERSNRLTPSVVDGATVVHGGSTQNYDSIKVTLASMLTRMEKMTSHHSGNDFQLFEEMNAHIIRADYHKSFSEVPDYHTHRSKVSDYHKIQQKFIDSKDLAASQHPRPLSLQHQVPRKFASPSSSEPMVMEMTAFDNSDDYHMNPSGAHDCHKNPSAAHDYHKNPSAVLDYHKYPSAVHDYHKNPSAVPDYHKNPSLEYSQSQFQKPSSTSSVFTASQHHGSLIQQNQVPYSNWEQYRNDYPLGYRSGLLPVANRDRMLERIKMPSFDGNHIHEWLVDIDHFFTAGGFREEDKLEMVALLVEGRVKKWFAWVLKRGGFRDWFDFKQKLLIRFSESIDVEPETRLFSIEHIGSVTDYTSDCEEKAEMSLSGSEISRNGIMRNVHEEEMVKQTSSPTVEAVFVHCVQLCSSLPTADLETETFKKPEYEESSLLQTEVFKIKDCIPGIAIEVTQVKDAVSVQLNSTWDQFQLHNGSFLPELYFESGRHDLFFQKQEEVFRLHAKEQAELALQSHEFDNIFRSSFRGQQREKLMLLPKSWRFKFKHLKQLRALPQSGHKLKGEGFLRPQTNKWKQDNISFADGAYDVEAKDIVRQLQLNQGDWYRIMNLQAYGRENMGAELQNVSEVVRLKAALVSFYLTTVSLQWHEAEFSENGVVITCGSAYDAYSVRGEKRVKADQKQHEHTTMAHDGAETDVWLVLQNRDVEVMLNMVTRVFGMCYLLNIMPWRTEFVASSGILSVFETIQDHIIHKCVEVHACLFQHSLLIQQQMRNMIFPRGVGGVQQWKKSTVSYYASLRASLLSRMEVYKTILIYWFGVNAVSWLYLTSSETNLLKKDIRKQEKKTEARTHWVVHMVNHQSLKERASLLIHIKREIIRKKHYKSRMFKYKLDVFKFSLLTMLLLQPRCSSTSSSTTVIALPRLEEVLVTYKLVGKLCFVGGEY